MTKKRLAQTDLAEEWVIIGPAPIMPRASVLRTDGHATLKFSSVVRIDWPPVGVVEWRAISPDPPPGGVESEQPYPDEAPSGGLQEFVDVLAVFLVDGGQPGPGVERRAPLVGHQPVGRARWYQVAAAAVLIPVGRTVFSGGRCCQPFLDCCQLILDCRQLLLNCGHLLLNRR